MNKTITSAVLGALFLVASAPSARAQTAAPAAPPVAAPVLSEAVQLRAQLHVANVEIVQLRAAVARLQAEADLLRLSAERQQIEADLRVELKPPAGHVFDWATQRFVPPPAPKQQ